MKKSLLTLLFFCCFIAAKAEQTNVYNQNGYKLIFVNYDATFDPALQQRMVKTFFTVYPELANAYNKKTLKTVTMVIDTAYQGVAATANGKVTISYKWMHQHPEDIDVITHEVMHIVQDYGDSNGPGWLTEGIADYARFKFGVNNDAAKWSLHDYKAGQNYTDAYRTTARFLVWIEAKYKPGIVVYLDSQMRKHAYSDDVWKQQTGKTLDELWKNYTENSAI